VGFPFFLLIIIIKAQMVSANTGVGSVWNKGSWHWEERNYTEFAKEFLSREWCNISINANDAQIVVYEVKELKGTANVTIRKQKQIFMFEFEGELYWKATGTKQGDEWKD
jgi:activator of HSP90 ATPase